MDILSHLLTDKCKQIKEEHNWTSVSRIVGEAMEDCVITMPCPICNDKALVKYKTNEKAKDVKCEKCNCQIQIKATKHTKKQQTSIKLLGAEYNTTCSSIKENNVHYLVLMYSVIGDKYTIDDIYFIDHADINESCIIPRNPLSSTARRAGWQGCMLVFHTFKSLKAQVDLSNSYNTKMNVTSTTSTTSDLLVHTNDTKKDARRRKTMGDLGEQYAIELLYQSGFVDIKNLNTIRANFPLFDLIAKKNDQYYVFTVKARNKMENSTGRVNPCYNICALKGSSHKRAKSIELLKEIGYPEIQPEYHYWITCPIIPDAPWIFYWGTLASNPKYDLLLQSDQYIGVKMSDDYLKTYDILGSITHQE